MTAWVIVWAAGTAMAQEPPTNPLEAGGGSQIYGPDFDPAAAKGHVVFFLYWGIEAGPNRACFTRMAEMQAKYAPTGRFVAVASHVLEYAAPVRAFLKGSGANFPVFQYARPPAANLAPLQRSYGPGGTGQGTGKIPMAYLFDHTGKLVAEGPPEGLYAKVEALVRAAPMPLPNSPMIEGVDVQACRTQAMSLVPGKPVAEAFKALSARAKAAKPDAAEAQALLNKAQGWLAGETQRLEALTADKPAEALEPLRVLAATTAGMPEGKKPAELLAALQKDPNVAVLAKIAHAQVKLAKAIQLGRDAKAIGAAETVEVRRQGATLKAQLDALRKRTDLSPALAAEASTVTDALADSLSGLPSR
ncbi:MAG: hypothetical protein NT031_19660 [Planctomycetota bacterium]|nr:hypothetical protein [Planctomycetota bacterium]